MRSFISNFKERLRLPRLFFRKPSRAEQIHGGPPLEFERPIPPIQWRGITVVVVLVVIESRPVTDRAAVQFPTNTRGGDNEDNNDSDPAPLNRRNRPLKFQRRAAVDLFGP